MCFFIVISPKAGFPIFVIANCLDINKPTASIMPIYKFDKGYHPSTLVSDSSPCITYNRVIPIWRCLM